MLLKRYKVIYLTFIFAFCTQFIFSAEKAKSMKVLINDVFSLAKKQYAPLAEKVYKLEGKVPRSTDVKGALVTSDISWWTSGFFPGSLWYIYEYTSDKVMLHYAQKFRKRIENENGLWPLVEAQDAYMEVLKKCIRPLLNTNLYRDMLINTEFKVHINCIGFFIWPKMAR